MAVAQRTTPRRLDRFWAQVQKGGKSTDCWEWTGGKSLGYGVSSLGPTHRVAWRVLRGEIPKHLVIDHLCRNRGCVNPDHLELVTPAVNTLRGISPPACNARRTHCLHGHPFNGDNVRVWGQRERRICVTCQRVITDKRRARYRTPEYRAAQNARRAAKKRRLREQGQ